MTTSFPSMSPTLGAILAPEFKIPLPANLNNCEVGKCCICIIGGNLVIGELVSANPVLTEMRNVYSISMNRNQAGAIQIGFIPFGAEIGFSTAIVVRFFPTGQIIQGELAQKQIADMWMKQKLGLV